MRARKVQNLNVSRGPLALSSVTIVSSIATVLSMQAAADFHSTVNVYVHRHVSTILIPVVVSRYRVDVSET